MRVFIGFLSVSGFILGLLMICLQWLIYLDGVNEELTPETQLAFCLLGTIFVGFVIGISVRRVPKDSNVVRFATFSVKAFVPGIDRWYFLFYGAHTEARLTCGPHTHYFQLKLGQTGDRRDIDCIGTVTFTLGKTKEALVTAGKILREGGTGSNNMINVLQPLLQQEVGPQLQKRIHAISAARAVAEEDALLAQTRTLITELYRPHSLLVQEVIIRFYIDDTLFFDREDNG